MELGAFVAIHTPSEKVILFDSVYLEGLVLPSKVAVDPAPTTRKLSQP